MRLQKVVEISHMLIDDRSWNVVCAEAEFSPFLFSEDAIVAQHNTRTVHPQHDQPFCVPLMLTFACVRVCF